MKILGIHNGHHSNMAILENDEISKHFETEKMLTEKYVRQKVDICFKYINKNEYDLIAATSHNLNDVFTNSPEFERDPFQKPYQHFKTEGKDIYTIHHHLAHSAYSFFPSPFDESLILTYDGKGDGISAMLSIGKENKIKPVEVLPLRVGLLFGAIGYYLFGMTRDQGKDKTDPAGKLMGLAAYGTPVKKWKEQIRTLFWNDKYVDAYEYLKNKDFDLENIVLSECSLSPRDKNSQDFMATVQEVLCEEITNVILNASKKYGIKNVCFGGGCGLNSVVNNDIYRNPDIDDVFVPPACHDGGLSAGAALYLNHHILGSKNRKEIPSLYLGQNQISTQIKQYTPEEIESKYDCSVSKLSDLCLIDFLAEKLNDGKIIALAKGNVESGPRALGNRSILATPIDPHMKNKINAKVKHREWYRPFAPIVLESEYPPYFDFDKSSKHMLYVAPVKVNNLPAITHVDGTARLQTVSYKDNPFIHNLLSKFKEYSQVPVLLNTSFNDRGQPLLDDFEKSMVFFKNSGLDYLVIDNYLIGKK